MGAGVLWGYHAHVWAAICHAHCGRPPWKQRVCCGLKCKLAPAPPKAWCWRLWRHAWSWRASSRAWQTLSPALQRRCVLPTLGLLCRLERVACCVGVCLDAACLFLPPCWVRGRGGVVGGCGGMAAQERDVAAGNLAWQCPQGHHARGSSQEAASGEGARAAGTTTPHTPIPRSTATTTEPGVTWLTPGSNHHTDDSACLSVCTCAACVVQRLWSTSDVSRDDEPSISGAPS